MLNYLRHFQKPSVKMHQMIFKVVHAQESKEDVREKAVQIAEKLQEMKLSYSVKYSKRVSKKTYIYEEAEFVQIARLIG